MNKRNLKTKKFIIRFLIGFIILCCITCYNMFFKKYFQTPAPSSIVNLSEVPAFSGNSHIELNGNVPFFSEDDYILEGFEKYTNLDHLGRVGVAYANICKEVMPTGDRGSISSVTPTGWINKRYRNIIEDGSYLYNRCHLIGYQLAGENANEQNLMTGTRYLNIEGMLPFENMIDDYIEENPNNHVLYRVTPIFDGNNLVANGVTMEGYSIEDNGLGIKFNVYAYNVQPGIDIDYSTGKNNPSK